MSFQNEEDMASPVRQLPNELVEKINNLTEFNELDRIDVFEELSKIFSLIPVRALPEQKKKEKSPVKWGWSKACIERDEFNALDYIRNNAGVACGPASGVIVLDIDHIEYFEEYLSRNNISEDFKKTLTIETGSGKNHYYYKYPTDGFVYRKHQEKKSVEIVSGHSMSVVVFDVQGLGSQVVAPGSIHPVTFKFYRIKNNLPIGPAPEWVLNLCRKESVQDNAALPLEEDLAGTKIKYCYSAQDIPEFEDDEDEYSDSSPQRRFKLHFDNSILWGYDKHCDKISHPAMAFKEGVYLAFPKSRRSYLCFDLDYADSANAWSTVGLPEPTIVIVNPQNEHSHILYELKDPVYWPCGSNDNKIRRKPIEYFNAIRFAYTDKLKADKDFTHVLIKNPFSGVWNTSWHDNSYTLKYLASFVKLPSKQQYFGNMKNGIFAGRNPELFYIARMWSNANIRKQIDEPSHFNSLLIYLNNYNSTKIVEHWPDRGPLDGDEVEERAKYVTEWFWKHKDDPRYNRNMKNYGVMKLAPIDPSLSGEEREKVVKDNKLLGTGYTHTAKARNTDDVLRKTIDKLIASGESLSDRNLSKSSGKSINTIRSRRDLIIDYINSKKSQS
ncbi:MAG: replication initiation protein [Solidesulfovibrio sp. DCME]|uniref:replication initiation protein n=1 Tax=Solidesulfovibrio sp. DCME TaxID=3447380 RepID=UPI003D0A6550